MEKSSFFNAHLENGVYDRTYQAEDFAKYFSTFIGNGVFPNPSTNCQVTANDNMTIKLQPGLAWINGYLYQNTDELQLAIDPADGVLNRQDRVVLRLDFINREIKAYVLKGEYTSSNTPHAPNLTRTADIYELGLAQIDVMAGVTKITQSAINDVRWQVYQCGIVSGTVQTVDITTLYNQYKTKFEEDENNFATKANSTYADFNKRLNDSYLEFTNNFNTWFDDNTTEWSDEFTSWFDGIKKKLSDDIATSLQNQIDILNESVTHKLTKDIVKEYSGEVITSNDTSEGFIRNLKLKGNTKYRRADGSHTNTWESGVSLESVGEAEKNSDGKYPIEVVSCGKNLFSTELFEKISLNENCNLCSWNEDTGVLHLSWNGIKTYLTLLTSQKIKKNTQYTLSFEIQGEQSWLPNTIRIEYTDGTESYSKTTLDSTTEYKKIILISDVNKTISRIYWVGVTISNVKNLQLEEGTTATNYESYKEDKRIVLLDSPLRKNDVLDLEKLKITRNYGSATFNGSDSENWELGVSHINSIVFYKGLSGSRKYTQSTPGSLLCDKFIYNWNVWSSEEEGVRIEEYGALQISILKSKLETQDVAGFKKWLQSNPVTVVYQLATPVVEDITNLIEPLSSYPNTTTVTTNNNIKANISCSMFTKEAEPLAQSFYDYYIKKLYKNAFNKNGDTMSGDINMGYNAVKTNILKNVDGETLVRKGILIDRTGNSIDTTEIGNENKPVVLKTLEKAPRVNSNYFVYHEGNKPTIEELGLTDYVNKTKTMYEEGKTTKFVKFASEVNKWGKVAEFNLKAANGCIAATFMVQTIGDNDNNSRYAIFSVNMKQTNAMGKKPKVLITTLLAKNFDAVNNIKGVLVENSSSLTKVELYIRQQTLWDGYIITCINGKNFWNGSFTMFEDLDLLDNVPTGISSTYYKPAYLQDFYINKDATLACCEVETGSVSVSQLNDCNISTIDFAFTASKHGWYRFDVSLQVNTKKVVVIIDGDTSNSLVVLDNAYSGSITLELKEGQVVKTVYPVPINDNANTYSSIATIDGARLTITACAR